MICEYLWCILIHDTCTVPHWIYAVLQCIAGSLSRICLEIISAWHQGLSGGLSRNPVDSATTQGHQKVAESQALADAIYSSCQAWVGLTVCPTYTVFSYRGPIMPWRMRCEFDEVFVVSLISSYVLVLEDVDWLWGPSAPLTNNRPTEPMAAARMMIAVLGLCPLQFLWTTWASECFAGPRRCVYSFASIDISLAKDLRWYLYI